MITGELRQKIDRVWDAFWSAGISNPLEVIEQITYLMAIRHLDFLQSKEELEVARTEKPVENPTHPEGSGLIRWSQLLQKSPQKIFESIRDDVFPCLRDLRRADYPFSRHLSSARFTITNPSALVKAIDMLQEIPVDDRRIEAEAYEYMLGKLTSAGQNGQFTTPRHIAQLMAAMVPPGPGDEICDPACGTGGLLVAAFKQVSFDAIQQISSTGVFCGFDFDQTMLRIASMNMFLNSIERSDIQYRDSLAEGAAVDAGVYSLILANPPFAGSLDHDAISSDLLTVVKTKKTELLFLALYLRLLKPGGRAAVIVPDGVLFGSSKAHKELRAALVEDHKLDGVVKLPAGAFKPYAGISASILLFTKTGNGGTDRVWFYEVIADGYSLDDKRTALLGEDKTGPIPLSAELTEAEHQSNNLPDVLRRWRLRTGSELERARDEQSFCVSKEEISAQGYELSLNRYAERPRYLVGGRLVTLADLFSAGLLHEGAKLTFNCNGKTHESFVTSSGWLELADGQQFRSPSRAATAAVGEGSFDGWQCWTLPGGETLDQLRQKFLTEPAAGTLETADDDAGLAVLRYEMLRQAKQKATEGSPVTLTVSELLGWWQFRRRGSLAVEKIAAELANHSLTTSPGFESVLINSTVQLVSAGQAGKDAPENTHVGLDNESNIAEEIEDVPVSTLTVGNLPSALGGIVSVSPSATFDEAITLMLINDYSQIPVLSGRSLRGAVTWKSIARARHAKPDAPFAQALVEARDFAYTQDLIDILPVLAEQEFILVRDQTNAIAGIVTASDLAAAYGEMATPFFLVGEFDQRLRRVLSSSVDLSSVRQLCDPEDVRKIGGFDDLSIGDYQRILENKEVWAKVGWSLDRAIFINRLNEIREIRNDLMHFNPEPLSEGDVWKIRHMINVLREYGA